MGGLSTSTAGWSDDRVSALTNLWADGLSASQIAGELGGITRNAVISKVHRLGLAGRKTTGDITRAPRARRAPKEPKPSGQRIKVAAPRTRTLSGSLEPLVIPTPIEDTAIPVEQRRTVVTIEDGLCRWPVNNPGTPEFFMCGGKITTRHVRVEGEWREAPCPYCAHHRERSIDRGGTSASLLRAETGRQNFTTYSEQRRAFGA